MQSPQKNVGDFRKYKDKTDYQIALQSYLIGLLSQHATIIVKKRSVKTKVTLPLICISQLSFDNEDSINFWQFIEERINVLFQTDVDNGVSKAAATTRAKKNRIILSNELLEDMLFELGYRFNYYFIFKKDGRIALRIITTIFISKNDCIFKDVIKQKGESINNYLSETLSKQEEFIIKKCDEHIQQIIQI